MKNLKITTELYLLLGGIAVALIFVVFFTRAKTSHVYDTYEAVIGRFDVVNVSASNICASYTEMTLAVSELFIGDTVSNADYESAVERISNERERVTETLDKMNSIIRREDLKAMVKEFEELSGEQDDIVDRVLELVKAGNLDEAYQVYENELTVIDKQNSEMVSELSSKCQQLADDSAVEAHDARKKSEAFVIIIAVIVVVIVFILTVYTMRDIRIPLEESVAVLKKISTGDINVQVKKHKNNEFGILADYMKELVDREHRVTKIANSISQGDLTVDVNPKIQEDILAHSLKDLLDNNNSAIASIRDAAVQVGIGASQVANASQALAQGSTEQASSLEQVTASITDITGKTRANADDAAKVGVKYQKDKKDEK